MDLRIALVDDEESLRETVGFALRREGYRVEIYPDGLAAWESFERDVRDLPDLAILDVLMPRMDGLELGADDYLCKPFSMRELAARVKVLFRRLSYIQSPAGQQQEAPLQCGPLSLDLQRYMATWNGARVELTVTEFMMLHALVRHPGHVKSRKQLTKEGYPNDTYVSDRTIDTHIKRLRRKFEEADPSFAAIETVYGVGYRWVA